jgi:hypothetical protein
MSVTINGTSGLVFNDSSTQATAATGFGFKNRIINGAMMISQRNGTSSITANDGTYAADRFAFSMSVSSKGTGQNSTTAPTGFTNSILFTSSSAYTVGAAEHFSILQKIEGLNIPDLAWGTASAATVTLSFWVRSSLTGTFGGSITNSAIDRAYPFTYTISAANTYEQKTVTIPGDTTGTWLTTNGIGMYVFWNLGAGATNSGTAGAWTGTSNIFSATGATSVVGTNGATFYITGVQLEKGSTATSFDYRPYGTELALCQRYCQYAGSGASGSFDNSTTVIQIMEKCVVTMRAAPSGAIYSGVTAAFRSVGSDFTAASPALANFLANTSNVGGTSFWTQVSGFTGGTSNAVVTARNNQTANGGNFILLTSEL